MRLRKFLTYGVIVALAAASAINYTLFIFPNQFAPSGLNGICTMFQYLTGFKVSYLSFLLNLPLALLVFFKVSRSLALRSMIYVSAFSLFLILFEKLQLSDFAYDTGTSAILGPLVAGIVQGSISSVLLRASTHTGGTDYIGSLIHKYHPEFNFFWTVFMLNVLVAGASFFVYGYKIEPVLLCILYSFTSSAVIDRLNKAGRSAVRFEIITDCPEELGKAIITQLHHSATLIPAKGMYQGKETNILVCVVNKTQSAALAALIRSFPGSFAMASHVTEVVGNFKHLDTRGREERSLLDEGDGTGL